MAHFSAEVFPDDTDGLQEALRLRRRRETPDPPFPLPCRLVRSLSNIVQAQMLSVLSPRQHLLDCRSVAGQLGGHHCVQLVQILRHDPAQEGLGRLPVAPILHQYVQYPRLRIHLPPHVIGPAAHLDAHHMDAPGVLGLGTPSTDPGAVVRPELEAPAPNALVRSDDPTLEHQFLDAPIAEWGAGPSAR